ncbi:MAG: hypothetical protein IPO27_05455 [Bacteroidetes bacterium]|nr:hypothetical protein [Bacteroidota bacterium]
MNKYSLLLIAFMALLFDKANSQICDTTGNVIIYSNYDGGQININVDVNIPNLKIGVVSYEPVTISLGGPFVNNITAVHFAGYYTTTNKHCNNTPTQTNIVGAPQGTDTIVFYPPSPIQTQNGWPNILCNYDCDTINNQGGCNTPDQVVAYFMQVFGGTMRYHFTQYGCWQGVNNVSSGGNCCIGYTPNALPLAAFGSSDTIFCDKQCIDFTDLSSGNTTSWLWTFTGANPSASTLQNPQSICYNNYGSFDVQLIACNAAGCDTILMPNFITELQLPTIHLIINQNDTLICNTTNVTYAWFNVLNPTLVLSTNATFIPTVAGSYYIVITDSNNCSVPSATTGVSIGFSEINEAGIAIYYDGNTQSLLINATTKNEISRIVLIDGNGKMVYEKNIRINGNVSMPVSRLSNGSYVYQAVVNGRLVSGKITVTK